MRYSIACFAQPDYDVEIACLESCQSEANPARYAPISSGEYLLNKIKATYVG
jgi:isopenicillin N synthase-like dioxygenase